MTITETRPTVDWDKERRKKRRRRLDTVDAGLVLVAAVLLGVGSHLFTDSLFRSRTNTVAAVVPETLPSTTLPGIEGPINLALTPGIDGVITDHRPMTMSGTATPGAIVSIGGLRSTSRSDGSWAITVLLKPGVNEFRVVAEGGAGNSAAQTLTVTYRPSTTTIPVAPTIDVTPTSEATTTAATTAVSTTAAATPTTRAPAPSTTRSTVPTTAPPTTASVPVDTEPTA
ncbi:MAG: hypothetical protein ABJD24_05185 [Acidimicrobiales bacterium]